MSPGWPSSILLFCNERMKILEEMERLKKMRETLKAQLEEIDGSV